MVGSRIEGAITIAGQDGDRGGVDIGHCQVRGTIKVQVTHGNIGGAVTGGVGDGVGKGSISLVEQDGHAVGGSAANDQVRVAVTVEVMGGRGARAIGNRYCRGGKRGFQRADLLQRFRWYDGYAVDAGRQAQEAVESRLVLIGTSRVRVVGDGGGDRFVVILSAIVVQVQVDTDAGQAVFTLVQLGVTIAVPVDTAADQVLIADATSFAKFEFAKVKSRHDGAGLGSHRPTLLGGRNHDGAVEGDLPAGSLFTGSLVQHVQGTVTDGEVAEVTKPGVGDDLGRYGAVGGQVINPLAAAVVERVAGDRDTPCILDERTLVKGGPAAAVDGQGGHAGRRILETIEAGIQEIECSLVIGQVGRMVAIGASRIAGRTERTDDIGRGGDENVPGLAVLGVQYRQAGTLFITADQDHVDRPG